MTVHSLPSSHGSKWISSAYRDYFKKSAWLWIAMIFTFWIIMAAVSALVPFLGAIAANVLSPVLVAGIMQGCREIEKGGSLKFEHLFAGFSRRFGELVTVGVLNLLFSAAAMAVVVVIGIVAMMLMVHDPMAQLQALKGGAWNLESPNALPMLMIGSLLLAVAATVFTVLAMAFWFAPILVYFEPITPMEAIKKSFLGCIQNIWPFTTYVLVALGWAIVAFIPFGLGFFLLIPVMVLSEYTSYREIFQESSNA